MWEAEDSFHSALLLQCRSRESHSHHQALKANASTRWTISPALFSSLIEVKFSPHKISLRCTIRGRSVRPRCCAVNHFYQISTTAPSPAQETVSCEIIISFFPPRPPASIMWPFISNSCLAPGFQVYHSAAWTGILFLL